MHFGCGARNADRRSAAMVVAFLISMWPGVFAAVSLALLAVRRGGKGLAGTVWMCFARVG